VLRGQLAGLVHWSESPFVRQFQLLLGESPMRYLVRQRLHAACKNPSLKTACDFEYSGEMIEQMLLGLVAYRGGKKIAYDGAAGKVTNCPEANALLSRKYRAGWSLNG